MNKPPQILWGSVDDPNGHAELLPDDRQAPALYYQTDVVVPNQKLWQWNLAGQNWTQLI